MRVTCRSLFLSLALAGLVGCARIEHATNIGSEQEEIPFYIYDERLEAALTPGTYEIVPGSNHVVVGFWLRPGGRNHFQYREELRVEYDPRTGNVVRGLWDSTYYNVGQQRSWEGEHDRNWIEGTSIHMPKDDGGTGWMTLSLGKEWLVTTRVVDIRFRRYTNPSRFPAEE